MSPSLARTREATATAQGRDAPGSQRDQVARQITERQRFARYLAKDPGMLFGFAIVVGLILLAMLAPALAPYGANERLLDNILQRPNAAHIFGTDMQGRDILSRVIHGSRISLGVAFPAVALAILVGAPVGLMAGYFGGLLDLIVMRVFEILFGFPAILLAVSIVAVMGPSLPNLVLTIALLYIPSIAMVVRAPTLSLKNQEFVTAATMVGARHGRILVRHILPNVAAPIVVQASLLLSTALLTEAALSFLGIGAQPPTPSWGADLGRGRQYMLLGPWQVIFPGAAIMVAVLGFNLLGDALRDFFDPRIRTRL